MVPRPILVLAVLALALPLRPADAQEPVRLGRFGPSAELQHDLAGELFALNDRVLEVRGFTYDGLGPDAFFWGDRGDAATGAGLILPERPGCAAERLARYSDDTVVFELPPGETLRDFGYISVWCRRAASSFGGLAIDPALVASLPSGAADTTCSSAQVEPFPVAANMNCEPLEQDAAGENDNLQVRWRLDGDDIVTELVGRITDAQYMGFGPSGSANRTDMLNADPVIAFMQGDEPAAVDYFMNDRSQCSADSGTGVCPDTMLASAGENHVTDVEGSRSGDLVRITFRRPLAAADDASDRPFNREGETFIVWAIGPVEGNLVLPQYHNTRTVPGGQSVSFEFARARRNNCSNMLFARDEEEAAAEVAKESPWPDRAPLVASEDTEIVARIGPSGGARGREAIVGEPGWGIAWYMNDALVPVIGVERNKTYRFRVQGGTDKSSGSKFHPLYITSDRLGGIENKDEAARAAESVWAQPVNGSLCQYEQTDSTPQNASTFAEYFESLDRSCADDSAVTAGAGLLTWKVAPDTPDVVYYQCATHVELGFMIRVFDEGKLNEAELNQLNMNTCSVTFKGELRSFQGCRKGLSGGVSVYWNVDQDKNELETLFMGTPPAGGYVGWGWGSTTMTGTSAAIAYAGPGGTDAQIMDYFLADRSTAGVQVGNRQKFKSSDVDVVGGEVQGLFTRALDDKVTFGETGAIWSIGPAVTAANSLQQHGTRASRVIDLSDTSGAGESDSSGIATVLKVHGALMALAWVVLAPAAAVVMRFMKRFNPTSFNLHRGVMVTATCVGIAAYVLGKVNSTGLPRGTVHLVIGSIVLGLSVLQVIAGVMRPEKGTSKRPLFNLAHGWGGRVTLLLAWANTYVGLSVAGAAWWLYLLVSVGVVLWVAVFIVLSTVLRARFPVQEEPKAMGDPEPEATEAM